jgi:hypothetical protein
MKVPTVAEATIQDAVESMAARLEGKIAGRPRLSSQAGLTSTG